MDKKNNVVPDPTKSCGPYKPSPFFPRLKKQLSYDEYKQIGADNHDTIGMVVLDSAGNVAGGTSTNGLNHKIPGRVGDSPIAGAGSYVDNDVGGAAATGDGDVMMRFLPSFYAVMLMKTGVSPSIATAEAIKYILRFYPDFAGAVLAINIRGEHEYESDYTVGELVSQLVNILAKVGAVRPVAIMAFGAACHGFEKFPYSIRSPDFSEVTVLYVPCIS